MPLGVLREGLLQAQYGDPADLGEPVVQVSDQAQPGSDFLGGRRTPVLAFQRGIGLGQGVLFVAHGPRHPVHSHNPAWPLDPEFGIGLPSSQPAWDPYFLIASSSPRTPRADKIVQVNRGGQPAGQPLREIFHLGA